jgi:hypothetical protein
MTADKIPLATLPFLAGGILVDLWRPLRVFDSWGVAVAAGAVLVVAGTALIVPARRSSAAADRRLAGGLLAAYAGISLVANTWWPIIFLIPALAAVIRWRAVQVQTGRRPPGD